MMSEERRMSAPVLALAAGIVVIVGVLTPGGALAQEEPEKTEEERRCICLERGGSIELPAPPELPDAPEISFRRGSVDFFGRRARLGILVRDRTGEHGGAVIGSVLEESPAEEAGLREGDEVVALSGKRLDRPLPVEEEGERAPARRLVHLMREVEPGDSVRLEIFRDGERSIVQVVAEEPDPFAFSRIRRAPPRPRGVLRGIRSPSPRPPLPPRFRPGRTPESPGSVRLWRGGIELELAELNPRLGEYFGSAEGVLVLNVGAEAELELRPGDIILAIGGREVDGPEDVMRILASYREDERVELDVLRDRRRINVAGR